MIIISEEKLLNMLNEELLDEKLLNKLPKKHHKYIKYIYKEGNRYSVSITFEDGFTRSIGEWNFSELKYEIKEIIENDRNAEF